MCVQVHLSVCAGLGYVCLCLRRLENGSQNWTGGDSKIVISCTCYRHVYLIMLVMIENHCKSQGILKLTMSSIALI